MEDLIRVHHQTPRIRNRPKPGDLCEDRNSTDSSYSAARFPGVQRERKPNVSDFLFVEDRLKDS